MSARIVAEVRYTAIAGALF